MVYQTLAVSEQKAGEHCGTILESEHLFSSRPQRVRVCDSGLIHVIKVFP